VQTVGTLKAPPTLEAGGPTIQYSDTPSSWQRRRAVAARHAAGACNRADRDELREEREDALNGAVAMLDRAWAVPTLERKPETVTKPSPAPEGEKLGVGKRLGR